MKKLFGYALVILNTQTKKTRIASGFVITDTKSEAEKSVLHYAYNQYPSSKHWSRHQFRVVQAQDTFTTEDGQAFQTLVELTSAESEQVS